MFKVEYNSPPTLQDIFHVRTQPSILETFVFNLSVSQMKQYSACIIGVLRLTMNVSI